MQKFKENWQISRNWQLIFPLLGLIGLGYSSFKLATLIFNNQITITLVIAAVIFYILLKLTLIIFEKLEKKWAVNYRWELISIFLVFATTGSSSMFVSRPLIKMMGINKENLPTFAYWVLYIVIGFIFYQILLVLIGWIFGQYKFFWDFEKKMLRRFGFKCFAD
ncbi:hypothetical protein QWY92_16980 [Algibacter miyuki]|uniref:DUF6787 family protein n=1 Tax=Algibacter miyuki TaxID=1306933 RepID=UPI0025B4671D|nr:DUF6787 family protein [Algibacter miyuki]MDN3667094.1 hypothetical protein [Algibacter miyuki]